MFVTFTAMRLVITDRYSLGIGDFFAFFVVGVTTLGRRLDLYSRLIFSSKTPTKRLVSHVIDIAFADRAIRRIVLNKLHHTKSGPPADHQSSYDLAGLFYAAVVDS